MDENEMMVSVEGGGAGCEGDALLLLLLLPSLILPSSMRKLIGAGSHLLPRMKWWPRRPQRPLRRARSNYMEANWNCYPSLPPACLPAHCPLPRGEPGLSLARILAIKLGIWPAGRAKSEQAGERIRRWDTIK